VLGWKGMDPEMVPLTDHTTTALVENGHSEAHLDGRDQMRILRVVVVVAVAAALVLQAQPAAANTVYGNCGSATLYLYNNTSGDNRGSVQIILDTAAAGSQYPYPITQVNWSWSLSSGRPAEAMDERGTGIPQLDDLPDRCGVLD